MKSIPPMNEVWQTTLNWQPNTRQQQLFEQLYHQVISANQNLNLTRITYPPDFWEKHLWDSLRGISAWLHLPPLSHLRIIDIGTGAGFPGVPIAIVLPDAEVTLLEATQKKVVFLNQLIQNLGLEKVRAIGDRAESIAQKPDHANMYDLATLRAVGTVTKCVQYAMPLLKPGGTAVLYRGHWAAAETAELQTVLPKFRGKLEEIESFTTPQSQGIRHCVYIKKL